MIEYYCGYPKCGKSLIAENRLSVVNTSVLYVGTLPNTRLYWSTIWKHRRRRPTSWDLYECTGDLLTDLNTLYQALDHYGGILLDGTTFYLNRLLRWGYRPNSSMLALLKKILAKAETSPTLLIVIDQPLTGMPADTRLLGRLFHRNVYSHSTHIYFVENGQEVLCSPRELYKLDR